MTVELENVPKWIRDRLPSVDAMGIRSIASWIRDVLAGLAAGNVSVAAAGVITGVDTRLDQTLADTLGTLTQLDERVELVENGLINGHQPFDTKALMDADLSHAAGTIAEVFFDPTEAYNTTYQKQGASGVGSWLVTNDRISPVKADVAALKPALALQELPRQDLLFAVVDPAGRILQKISLDGTMYAKLAIGVEVANGLSLLRQDDGSYKLRFGTVEGVLPLPSSAVARNTRVLTDDLWALTDGADRQLIRVEQDGTVKAKFAVAAGAGLLRSGSAASGYTLALDVENILPGQGFMSQTQVEEDLFGVIDAQDRVLLRIRSDGTIIGKFEVSLDELEAARGNRAQLKDRLDQSLTPYGMLREPIAGEWFLRETRQRLRLLALGEAGRLTIAAIGDSWTHNAARWSGTLATAITAAYGDAGPGWTGLAWGGGTAGLVNGNARPSVVGYTPSLTNWTVTYGSAVSADVCAITSSTAGAGQTITGPASCSAVILHFAGGDGAIQYRWNGGSWTSLSLSGSGYQTATLAGLPSIAWTLELQVVSGTCTMFGLDVQKNVNGVRFHKLGATGSRAQQWAAVAAADWQSGISALAPNLAIIMHGTNDQGASRTASAYRADVQTLIDRLRTAVPAADILLVAPCENGRGLSILMSDYAVQLRELAASNSCAFLDLQPFFGLAPADYAAGSARPWFNADTIHPDPASGGRAIMDAIYRLLTTR